MLRSAAWFVIALLARGCGSSNTPTIDPSSANVQGCCPLMYPAGNSICDEHRVSPPLVPSLSATTPTRIGYCEKARADSSLCETARCESECDACLLHDFGTGLPSR
jgi:hypothetical protein